MFIYIKWVSVKRGLSVHKQNKRTYWTWFWPLSIIFYFRTYTDSKKRLRRQKQQRSLDEPASYMYAGYSTYERRFGQFWVFIARQWTENRSTSIRRRFSEANYHFFRDSRLSSINNNQIYLARKCQNGWNTPIFKRRTLWLTSPLMSSDWKDWSIVMPLIFY